MFTGIALAIVFAGLASVHFYWGAGGQAGLSAAVPEDREGRRLFSPGPLPCFVVGLGLLSVGDLCLACVQIIPAPMSASWMRTVLFVVSGLFFLRSVGDFRYVGFFRRVSGSSFAKMDRLIYAPFCLIVAILLLLFTLLHVP